MKNSKLYSVSIVFLSICSLTQWMTTSIFAPSRSIAYTEKIILVMILLSPCLHVNYSQYKIKQYYGVFLFLAFSLFEIISSGMNVVNKSMQLFLYQNTFALSLSFCVFYLTFPSSIKRIYRYLYSILPLVAVLLLPFFRLYEALGYLFGLYLLTNLFIGDISKKKRIINVVLSVLIMFIAFFSEARGQILKFGVALLCGYSFYYFRSLFIRVHKYVILFFLLSPIVFLFLGVTNRFNVFQINGYWKNHTEEMAVLTADTRTVVYWEAITSALTHNSIISGRGINHGYDSHFQYKREGNIGDNEFLTSERTGEVAIVNFFTWGGVIYVILYGILILNAIYLALFKSSNSYLKMLALYLAFLWFFSWIEMFQALDATTFHFWIVVAICISPVFRKYTDNEFKMAVTKIF